MAATAALFGGFFSGVTTQAKSSGGGIVSFAEPPGEPPTYIFPLLSPEEDSNTNLGQFVPLMYPSLYAYDDYGAPGLNESLSLAKPPVFTDNNTVATVTLKHWVWSNGEPITARDIIFWMNLVSAVTDPNAPTVGSSTAPGPGWANAVPGDFPVNVVSYNQSGTYTVVFHLNRSYNPTWFLDNEFSQIYPIPQQSWDELSASGPIGDVDATAEARIALPGTSPTRYVPANPGTADTGALGVAEFLNLQALDLSTYQSNPLWQVVDGAFRLTQFTTSGFAKFVPNTAYSGTPKPRMTAFEELPFTTDSAEFDVLRSGKLTIGYLPTTDVGQRTFLEKNEGYSYSPWYEYEYGSIPYNFTNPTAGAIFRQLYFRQALQSLVNQDEYIKDFDAGVGNPTIGPVPTYPRNALTSPLESHGQIYPYNPSKAVSLLKSDGWTVRPGGTSYCSKPGTATGDCGAGISLNQRAVFKLQFASGSTPGASTVEAMQSTLRRYAGIDLQLSEAPFTDVLSTQYSSCTYKTPCADWQLSALFVGFTYIPDYLPTGEETFATGSADNPGDYSNVVDDRYIEATLTAPTQSAETSALFKYENFLARQLPVIWMPSIPVQLTMYKSGLKGVLPQGIVGQITPQFYVFG